MNNNNSRVIIPYSRKFSLVQNFAELFVSPFRRKLCGVNSHVFSHFCVLCFNRSAAPGTCMLWRHHFTTHSKFCGSYFCSSQPTCTRICKKKTQNFALREIFCYMYTVVHLDRAHVTTSPQTHYTMPGMTMIMDTWNSMYRSWPFFHSLSFRVKIFRKE